MCYLKYSNILSHFNKNFNQFSSIKQARIAHFMCNCAISVKITQSKRLFKTVATKKQGYQSQASLKEILNQMKRINQKHLLFS